MPFLVRIILQRLLIVVFSVLAFFGINPDVSVPPKEVVEERKIEQQERVEDILQIDEGLSPTQTPQNETIKEVEKKITEIQKEFTKTVTEPVVETAKDVISPNLVFEDPSKFNVQNVVVNIVCLEKTKTYTRMTSGSGVIVSPTGLILTNAHVAFPFLKSSQFGNSTYSCSVRRENIPNYGYNVELVYYPVDWLANNSEVMKEASPVGTGENDYAFVQITTPLGPTPKITSFPYASTKVTFSDLKANSPITVAGYPATNSGVLAIDTKPGLKVAESIIADFFTFKERSFDVLQTGVNNVAHRGSSGGGIFNKENLYGIIVTTNTNASGSYINALTLPYIKKDFEKDTGISFNDFVNSPKETLEGRFNTLYKSKIVELISSN